MLSDSSIRELANGKGSTYIFDLSNISMDFYEPLFKTLQKFIPKYVDSLGFTCDSLNQARRNANSGNSIPESITNSIAKNRRHYLLNTVELLIHVITRSTRLKSIKLSNLELQIEQIRRIAEAISKSVSLDTVIFNRLSIGDQGLKMLLSILDPNQIHSLSVLNCGLTQHSTSTLINFAKSRACGSGGISKIDLSVQEIPQNDIAKIQQALKTSIRSSPSKGFGVNSPSRSTNEEKYEALKKENQQLKEELEALKRSVNIVPYNEKVFVIGKGAKQFVQFLNEIESKIKILEEQKSNMTSFV